MSLTVADVQAVRVGWDGADKRLNIGATATSANVTSQIVALSSDVGYHLSIGGTAATTDFYVPGGIILFNRVDAKSINCITATGGNGTLYISETL